MQMDEVDGLRLECPLAMLWTTPLLSSPLLAKGELTKTPNIYSVWSKPSEHSGGRLHETAHWGGEYTEDFLL